MSSKSSKAAVAFVKRGVGVVSHEAAVSCDLAIIDVKDGRETMKKMIEGGACCPVVIEGVINDIGSEDDGVSREFEVRVTKFTPKGRIQPFLTVSEAKAGVRVVTDGGFSCMPENAVRTIRKDKAGLYVSCADGKHYLDGQYKDTDSTVIKRPLTPHYTGLYKVNP